VLGVALSGAGLRGSSGRRDGKNRQGGTLVVFGERSDDVVTGAAESSASGSVLGPALLPSRPDGRQREVKSVKSTVWDMAGALQLEMAGPIHWGCHEGKPNPRVVWQSGAYDAGAASRGRYVVLSRLVYNSG
jgi:hypothetical protein